MAAVQEAPITEAVEPAENAMRSEERRTRRDGIRQHASNRKPGEIRSLLHDAGMSTRPADRDDQGDGQGS